jgi:hypothetical protein
MPARRWGHLFSRERTIALPPSPSPALHAHACVTHGRFASTLPTYGYLGFIEPCCWLQLRVQPAVLSATFVYWPLSPFHAECAFPCAAALSLVDDPVSPILLESVVLFTEQVTWFMPTDAPGIVGIVNSPPPTTPNVRVCNVHACLFGAIEQKFGLGGPSGGTNSASHPATLWCIAKGEPNNVACLCC